MVRKDLPLIRFYDQDFVDVYEQSWNRIDSAMIKGSTKNGFAKEFFVYEPSGVINQTEAIFSTFFLVYSNGCYNSSSCLDNFYAKQEADGAIRGVYSLEDGRPILTEENPEGVLPPLFSYAELNIYHKVGNKKRLKDVIEILCRYYDWLEEKFLAPNGLYAVTPLAGGRNCPLRAEAFYPIDFNCQQAVNALYLSAIGELLNDRDIGFKYKKKYFSLKTRINEKMWDDEAGFYFDLKKDEYKVTISGWLIPSDLNETNVKWINESGISTLFAIGAGDGVQSFYSYDEKAEKTLTLLGNNGVKVYVNPGVSDGTAYRKISEFKQNDAVLGICVDEPNKSQMTSMAAQVDWWNKNSDGRNFYSNLFPSFAQVVQKEFDGGCGRTDSS